MTTTETVRIPWQQWKADHADMFPASEVTTRHAKKVSHPVLREKAGRVGDALVAVLRAFVVRLLTTATVLAIVVERLAYAQKVGGDTDAAVLIIVVGYLGICAVIVVMARREYQRRVKADSRQRSEGS